MKFVNMMQYKELMKLLSYIIKFLSPNEKLGRRGFAVIFLLAILLLWMFTEIAWAMFLSYRPHSYWQVNLVMHTSLYLSAIGLFCGILPLMALVLANATCLSYVWGYMVGYNFLLECIIADLLFVVYVILCIRRCRDFGKHWIFILIPLMNPYALLLVKSDSEED